MNAKKVLNKITVAELAETLSRISTLANEVGVKFNEMASLIAATK